MLFMFLWLFSVLDGHVLFCLVLCCAFLNSQTRLNRTTHSTGLMQIYEHTSIRIHICRTRKWWEKKNQHSNEWFCVAAISLVWMIVLRSVPNSKNRQRRISFEIQNGQTTIRIGKHLMNGKCTGPMKPMKSKITDTFNKTMTFCLMLGQITHRIQEESKMVQWSAACCSQNHHILLLMKS